MKWLTILFGLFILLIILLADAGQLDLFSPVYRIPFGDKVGHFVLYGILALLINLTLFRSRPHRSRRWIAMLSGLVLALLIGLEEFSQRFFADRTFSLIDLTASYLGVAVFSWLAVRTRKQMRGDHDPNRSSGEFNVKSHRDAAPRR